MDREQDPAQGKTERRKKTRRASDRVLQETVRILRILERISRGEDVDFGEHYADLVGFKEKLGRRREDRLLCESLCGVIEALASNIQSLMGKEKEMEKTVRRVKVTKVLEKGGKPPSKEMVIFGWEKERPRVGKSYKVIKEEGGLFCSAIVTKVESDHIRTINSLYKIEELSPY
jgi:hypothetical protein